MRILLLRGGALGDFIVTLPAIAALRRRWPDARIDLVGNAVAAALALRPGWLDAVHSQQESRWSALYGPGPLPPALATWLAQFELVLNYWPDPERELARHFPLHASQQFISTPAQPVSGPAAAHYCAPLRQLGITPNSHLITLRTPVAPGRSVAVHPGSGSRRKNWPAARWTELMASLAAEVAGPIKVIVGEAEPPGILAGIGVHLRSLPLDKLADQLADCRLFIGHDSGISHLAAACGPKCVLLFGPTDPAIWAPPGAGVTVLRKTNDPSSISVAEVRAAALAALRDQS